LGSSSKKGEEKKRRKNIEPKYSSKSSKFKREKYPLKEQSKIRFHVFTLTITIVPPYIHHHIYTHSAYIGPHTCIS
jgi:hypothetical protein